MKKYLHKLVTAAALVVAIAAMFKISDLQGELRQLRNELNSSISSLQSSQQNMLSYAQQLMEQEASILAAAQFSLGGMSVADKTCVLTGSVTPKEHQPGVTEAFLTVNGKDYPMELKNGAYEVKITLSLFAGSELERVQLREGDVVRTEVLNRKLSPRYELLPTVSASLSGTSSGSAGKNGVYTWHHKGELEITVEGKAQLTDVRSIVLIEMLDGVEISRTEIPLVSETAEIEAAQTTDPGFVTTGSDTFICELNRDFLIPFGSTLELLVEVTDANNLHYRTIIDRWQITESGEYNYNPSNTISMALPTQQITDANGNTLYEEKAR